MCYVSFGSLPSSPDPYLGQVALACSATPSTLSGTLTSVHAHAECTECCVAAKPRSSCCLQVLAGAPAKPAQLAEVEVCSISLSIIMCKPVAIKPSSSTELAITVWVGGIILGLLWSPHLLSCPSKFNHSDCVRHKPPPDAVDQMALFRSSSTCSQFRRTV